MRENRSSEFPTRSDTNRPAQSQKLEILDLWRRGIALSEELHYPCNENKGADQLRRYCEADLHLCFRKGGNPVFS